MLNAGQTKNILIRSRQKVKAAQPLNLLMKNNNINQLISGKLLGVTLDESLSWRPHCESVLKDCSKALGLLYRFFKYIPRNTLKSIAEALVLSKLNYCCTIWRSLLNKNSLNALQILQNKVANCYLAARFMK